LQEFDVWGDQYQKKEDSWVKGRLIRLTKLQAG
jgi:hypothetical protein